MAVIDAAARVARQRGLAIPACPLALNAQRRLDERRQRALFRYYLAAGAGGVGVGGSPDQVAIPDQKVGLFKPVLELAVDELRRSRRKEAHSQKPGAGNPTSDSEQSLLTSAPTKLGIAGICGQTKQALGETALARELGFHAGLLSLGALRDAGEDELLDHCRKVAEVIPLFGFYS